MPRVSPAPAPQQPIEPFHAAPPIVSTLPTPQPNPEPSITLKNIKATKLPPPIAFLATSVNVLWTIAWTISRAAIALILSPFLYLGFKLTANPSPAAAPTAAKTNKKALETMEFAEQEVKYKKSEKPKLHDAAHILEQVKRQARKSPENRQTYFDYYNHVINDIFSHNGFERNTGHPANEDSLELARESYVNLTLVYRFDGETMVGKKINLMHDERVVEYTVVKYFQDPGGLVAYGLKPTSDPQAPPRLIVRGTNRSAFTNADGKKVTLPTGFAADLSKKIGKQTYESRQGDIQQWLAEVTEGGQRKAMVSGHSLGGAIAQRIAIDNPNYVGKLFTLNAPQIEDSTLKKFPKGTEMSIQHAVMEGDTFVPYAGTSRLGDGGLLSSGAQNEVAFISGGGHTSPKVNDYLLRGTHFDCRWMSVRNHRERKLFWDAIVNFIRPHL